MKGDGRRSVGRQVQHLEVEINIGGLQALGIKLDITRKKTQNISLIDPHSGNAFSNLRTEHFVCTNS